MSFNACVDTEYVHVQATPTCTLQCIGTLLLLYHEYLSMDIYLGSVYEFDVLDNKVKECLNSAHMIACCSNNCESSIKFFYTYLHNHGLR